MPGKVRPQIGLAYLLARMTDTVADTGVLPVSERLESLRALQDRINDSSQRPLNFGLLAGHQSSEGERVLLKKAEEILKLLQETNEWDRREIVRVLAIITGDPGI
jgi:phytoene/squalene synthetase